MIVAAYTWAEWLWGAAPGFFVGWYLHDVIRRLTEESDQ